MEASMRSPPLDLRLAGADWPAGDESEPHDLSCEALDCCDQGAMVSALLQMALSVSEEGVPWADDVSVLLLSGWGALQAAASDGETV
jgi:hypothetical protein